MRGIRRIDRAGTEINHSKAAQRRSRTNRAIAATLEQLESRRLLTSLTWNPQGSSTAWDTTTPNWLDTTSNTQVAFSNGDSVTFGDGTNQNSVVVASGGVSPANIYFNNVTRNYNLSGAAITGGAPLVKDGAANLVIQGAGNAWGTTDINAGFVQTFVVSGNGALPDNSAVTVASGATLQVNNFEATGSLAGGGVVQLGGNLTAGQNGGSTVFSGQLTGIGQLIKAGGGNLTLAGSSPNTNTGQVDVLGGTLTLAKNPGVNALQGSGFGPGDLAVENGASAVFANSDQLPAVAVIGIRSGGTVDFAGYSDSFNGIGSNGTILASSGTINLANILNLGGGSFSLASGGSLTASSVQFSAVSVSVAGSLTGTADARLQADNVHPITIQPGGSITTGSNQALIIGDATTVQAGAVLNIGSGGAKFDGASAVINLQADASNPARMNLAGDLLAQTGAGHTYINSVGSGQAGILDLGSADRTFTVNEVMYVSAQITGSVGLTIAGSSSSKVGLSGPNTYSGLTQLNGPYVALGSSTALGSTAAGTIVANGVNLDPYGQTIAENVTFAGNAELRNESLNDPVFQPSNHQPATWNGNITVNGNLVVTGNQTLTINGNISGPGSLDHEVFPLLQLGGNNSYTGSTTLGTNFGSNGTVEVLASAVNGIPDLSAVVMSASTTLKLDGAESIGSLSGPSGAVVNTAGTLTTGLNNTQTGFQGNITGAGGLTKAGSGEFDLSANDSYGGDTNVLGGNLQIGNPSNSIPDNSAVTIASGALITFNTNETIGSLAGAGTADLHAVVTVGNNNASTTFSGVLTGANGMVKIGSGTLRLAGTAPNTAQRTLDVQGGTIEFAKSPGVNAWGSADPSEGDVHVDGGTLRWLASDQLPDAAVVNTFPTAPGTIDLNGFTETVNSMGLGSAGDAFTTGAGGHLTLNDFHSTDGPGAAHVTVGVGASITAAKVDVGSGSSGTCDIFGTVNVGSVGGNVRTPNVGAFTIHSGGSYNSDGGSIFWAENNGVVQAGGQVNIGSGGLAGANGILSLASDNTTPAQFNLTGGMSTQGNAGFTINSTGSGALPGMVNLLAGNHSLTSVGGGFNMWIAAQIAGPGGLSLDSTEGVFLSGANTYQGTTTVNSGAILQIQSATALGSSAAGTIVNSGGSLDLFGQSPVAEPVTLNGNGTGIGDQAALVNMSFNPGGNQAAATLNGVVTLASDTLIGGWNGGGINFNGQVTGPGKLIDQNFRTVALTNNANDYSGGTVLTVYAPIPSLPTVEVTASNALGSGAVTLTAGTLQLVSTSALNIPNALNVSSNGTTTPTPTILVDDGTLGTGGTNAETTHIIGGAVSIASGATLNVTANNNYNLRFTGSMTNGGTLFNAGTSETTSPTRIDIAGPYSGTGAIKTNYVVSLSSTAFNTEGVHIMNNLPTTVQSVQQLLIDDNPASAPVTLAGQWTPSSGINSNVVLRNGASFKYGPAAGITLNSGLVYRVVGDAGGGTAEFDPAFQASTGFLSLVIGGLDAGSPVTVITNSTSNLPTTNVTFGFSGAVDNTGTWSVRTNPQTFAGTITTTNSGTIDTQANLTTTNNGTNILSVAAGKTLTVTNSGTGGKMTLGGTGTNTLTGSLAVLGILDHINHNLTVNQTLSGTGSVLATGGSATRTTISGSASVASPGDTNGAGIGTLTVANLTLAATAHYNARLEATGDKIIAVAGSSSAAGPIITGSTLTLSGSAPNNSYTLIDNTTTLPVTGTFAGLPEGTLLTVNGHQFRLTYIGGDGNDVVLQSPNTPPVAIPDSYTVAEDHTLTANDVNGTVDGPNDNGVLVNDTDVDGNTLTASLVSGPAHGTLTFNSNGTFTYTPSADYNGPDQFTYKANDGTTDGNVATVSINVTEVNDPPVASDDSLSNIAEDSGDRSIPFSTLLANDTAGPANESGQTLTITSVSNAIGGTVQIVGTNVIFSPDADYNGPASFDYTVQDNGTTNGVADPRTDVGSASFTITEVNDDPTAGDDSLSSIAEDSGDRTISFASLLGNDSAGPANESGQSLTITSVSNAIGGTVQIVGTDVIFSPNPDYNGPASFDYTVQDNGTTNGIADPKSDIGSVSFTITEVNDVPIAQNDSAGPTAEDTDLNIPASNLLANDSNGPANETGQARHVISVSATPATHGTVTLNDNGTPGNYNDDYIVYHPDANYNGPATFTYTMEDNGTTNGVADPKSNSASVTLSVSEVNQTPTANDDSLSSIAEDSGTRTIPFATLLSNDSAGPADESGQTLTIISVGSAIGGTVSISGTDVLFTPAADYFGPASFSYTIQDNGTTNGSPDPKTDVGSVSFAVTEVNDAPTANNDNAGTTPEDTDKNITTASLLGNDSAGPANESGQGLHVVSVSATGSTNGTVTLNDNGTPGNYSDDFIVFHPDANYFGPASFTYVVQDDGTTNGVADPKQASASVSLNVTPVNDNPTASNDSDSVNEDGSVITNVVTNDSAGPANENQSLSVTAVTQGAHGTVTNNNGTITYTPAANYFGPDSYTYTIQDSDGATATATVSITVNSVNDIPTVTANSNAVTVNEGQVATNTGSFNDFDTTDNVTITASEGTITKSGTNTGTWTWSKSTSDDEATHSVTITANDGHGGIASVTFTLTVNNVAPTARPNSYTSPQSTPRSGNVITDNTGAGVDSDPAGANDPLVVTTFTQPTNGTVVVASDGSFTYTPNNTFTGVDTFTYTIGDGDGGSSVATVTISVGQAAPGSVTTVPDTCENGTALLIMGTSGNDSIHISPGSGNTISVTINGITTTRPTPTGRIIVIAGAGDDDVQIAGAISNSAWVYGEAGNDNLNVGNASPGGNLIIGGAGNDQMNGGSGRDVMVGGDGADKIIGNPGDDILVAGYTLKDDRSAPGHQEFWCDVMEEWTSGNVFMQRVDNLRNGTGGNAHNGLSYLLPQIRDDGDTDEVDMLNGSAGNDWFIFASGEDKVSGQTEASDIVN